MLKIEHTEVMGWEAAIRGMRNPLNSWDQSDSRDGCELGFCFGGGTCCDWYDCHGVNAELVIGEKDYDLMKRLRNAGTDHRKFMRMLTVYCDITAPLYWWKEYDTYKVGTVANSCSTMHKIHDKEFTLDDFSHEHLLGKHRWSSKEEDEYFEHANTPTWTAAALLNHTINMLNFFRQRYIETKDKIYWWQMIQLLPTSYNQKRTVMLNYEVLANIYRSRRHHKLDEWHTLCDWIEELPYAELITGKDG